MAFPDLIDDVLVERVLGELLKHVLLADLDLKLYLMRFVVGGLTDVGAHAGIAVVHALVLLHGLPLLIGDFDAAAHVGAQALFLEYHLLLAPDFIGNRLDSGEDVDSEVLPREAYHISLPLRTNVGMLPVLEAAGLLRGLQLALSLVLLLDLVDVGGDDIALIEELSLANQDEEKVSAVSLGVVS